MTAYRFVTLTCDSCGEVFDDGQSLRVRDARAAAKAEGWAYARERGDTCPRHHGFKRVSGFGWMRVLNSEGSESGE